MAAVERLSSAIILRRRLMALHEEFHVAQPADHLGHISINMVVGKAKREIFRPSGPQKFRGLILSLLDGGDEFMNLYDEIRLHSAFPVLAWIRLWAVGDTSGIIDPGG